MEHLEHKDCVIYADGYNIFYKYYQMHTAKDSNADPIGGFVGSLNFLQRTIAKFSPSKVYIVFDGVSAGQRRRNILKTYKDKRGRKSRSACVNFGDEHKVYVDNEQTQISLLFDALKKLPVTIIAIPYFEADDVIGYMCKKEKDCTNIIVSTDKDYLQLINDNTFVWSHFKEILYDRNKLEEKYKVPVENFLFYRTVIGDSSDNLAGVKGFKDKTLFELFPEIQTEKIVDFSEFLDKITHIESESTKSKKLAALRESKDQLILMHKLMHLDLDSLNMNAINILKSQIESQANKPLSKLTFKMYAAKHNLLSHMKPDYDIWIRCFMFLNQRQCSIPTPTT